MAELCPFKALRYTPVAGDLSELVCPPYDIISEEERQEYLRVNPRNIIRLELPKEGDDPYRAAGQTLREWLGEGYLAEDEQPAFYMYEEAFTVNDQPMAIRGIVCRVRLEEWEKGVVLPHEETLSKAKTDRFNLMKATGCNFSSIYSLYFDESRAVDTLLEEQTKRPPLLDFPSRDGLKHKVWAITDSATIQALSRQFTEKKLYIADGHHRYETAINYRNHLRQQGIADDHPANFVMMTLVSMEHPGLVVFPTHRVIRELEDFNADALLEMCREFFTVESISVENAADALREKETAGKTSFVLYSGDSCSLLTLINSHVMDSMLPKSSQAYRSLDVNVLHLLILEKLLGIDKENMSNQKNLIYTRDSSEAIRLVQDRKANCAFLINATKVAEIAQVAAAGEKMPQKSTYFYPKLITGHLMNKLL